jgi:hypothetical protein
MKFHILITLDLVISTSMQKHQWRDESDEGKRFFRATYHAGEWKLYSQMKDEEGWVHHDPIPVELLEKLREVMWNKYQRGRCPHKLVTKIDKMLGKD